MEWRRWIYAIPARLTAIFRRRRVEKDLDDELGFHVAMQTRANAHDGMSDDRGLPPRASGDRRRRAGQGTVARRATASLGA